MSIAGGAPGTARDGYRAAAPAEPTGELREALAEWLFRYNRGPLTFWHEISEVAKDSRRDDADQLLSGPLAPLLAKLRAVEALAADDEEVARMAREYEADKARRRERDYWHTLAGVREQSAARLRAALATPQTGQHTTEEDSNTADELAAAGLRACCGQPSERHCR